MKELDEKMGERNLKTLGQTDHPSGSPPASEKSDRLQRNTQQPFEISLAFLFRTILVFTYLTVYFLI